MSIQWTHLIREDLCDSGMRYNLGVFALLVPILTNQQPNLVVDSEPAVSDTASNTVPNTTSINHGNTSIWRRR